MKLKKLRPFFLLGVLLIILSEMALGQITQRGSFTTATGTNTITITKPTGVVAGDVMIVNIVQNDNDNATLSNATLSGWTLIDGRRIYEYDPPGGGVGNIREWWGTVLYKVAGGSEGANYAFTCTNADMSIGSIVAFSGVDATGGVKADGTSGGPFDVDPGTIDLTNAASVTASTITTTTANALVMMLAQTTNDRTYSEWTTTSPGALTEGYDNLTTNGDNASIGAAWAIKPTNGATGNGTATLSGSDRNGGILIALKPCTPPSTPTASNNGPICVGSSLSLTASAISGATYSWTGPNSFTSTLQNPTVSTSATTAMSGTYSVTATVSGCTSSAGITTVVVNPSTVADFSASSTSIVQGNSVTFSDLSTGSPTVWVWSFPGGTPSTSTDQNPTVVYNSVGTYNVTLTATGCDSDVEVKTGYITVTAPNPCVSGTIWSENFNTYSDGTTQGVTLNGSPKWTVSGAVNATLNVTGSLIEYRGSNLTETVGTWTSQAINIAGYSNVSFSLLASTNNTNGENHETSDYTDVFYSIDGGAFIRVTNWNTFGDVSHTLVDDDWTPQTVTVSGLSGNTLAIRVGMITSVADEQNRFDDVLVSGTPTSPTVNNPGNQTFDEGDIVNISFTGSGTTYLWTNDNTAIGLGASGVGTALSFTATNSGSSPIVGSITVTPSNGTCSGTPVTFTITVNPGCTPVGNPTVFGTNSWNVYAYEGNGIDLTGITYSGYYTESNFSFSTLDRWGLNNAPSDASGYQGCPVSVDNHTFVYKREGFPTGTYQITVGHDDGYELYIDDVLVSSSLTWDANTAILLPTSYILNSTSKIEFRVEEDAGESRGALTFTLQCVNPTSGGTIASAQTMCSGGDPVAFTSTAPASGESGTLEYKWQSSTTNSSSGFSDIGEIGLIYDVPAGLTQTTWYKRLSKVTCSGVWETAGESNVLEVTVNPIPTATLSGGGAICNGASTTLSVDFTGTGPWELTTQRNGAEPVTVTNISINPYTFDVSATGTYTISAFNDDLCDGTFSGSAVVTVIPLPTAGISDDNGPLCAGDNAIFTLTGTSGAVVTYNVNSGSDQTVTLTSGTATITISAAADDQTLTLVSVTNGTCSQTLGTSSTITVNPLPTVGSFN